MAQIREQDRGTNHVREWLESILSPTGSNQRRRPFACLASFARVLRPLCPK